MDSANRNTCPHSQCRESSLIELQLAQLDLEIFKRPERYLLQGIIRELSTLFPILAAKIKAQWLLRSFKLEWLV